MLKTVIYESELSGKSLFIPYNATEMAGVRKIGSVTDKKTDQQLSVYRRVYTERFLVDNTSRDIIELPVQGLVTSVTTCDLPSRHALSYDKSGCRVPSVIFNQNRPKKE